ncbi:MAG TPA: DUF3313 family protein [Steroidobacteraceae bacterium]|jgi:hypothetical protein
MKYHRAFHRSAVLAVLLLAASVSSAQKKELVEALSYDGLQEIKVKGIDMAYALPGATLSGYKQVMIDPVNVLFAKNWKPQETGSRRDLSTNDVERIRSNVAKLVHDTFIDELKKGGYTVAAAPGPDVLEVRPGIINLYVTAPDTMSAGRSRTYTTSAGEMTLVAELADSVTGQVIVRVLDRYRARDTGNFRMSSSVDNANEARTAALSWAKILRDGLDKAKDIGSN